MNRAERRALRCKHDWQPKNEHYPDVMVCTKCTMIADETAPPERSKLDNPGALYVVPGSAYQEGWDDGQAGREPNPDRLAYGSTRCNAYERGYIDSGAEPTP